MLWILICVFVLKAIDIYKTKKEAEYKREAWKREQKFIELLLRATDRQAEILAERWSNLAAQKAMQTRIPAQTNLEGESQWVVNFRNALRPGVTWLMVVCAEVGALYFVFTDAMPATDFLSWNTELMGYVLAFYFLSNAR